VLVCNAALGLLPMMAARAGAKSVVALEHRALFAESLRAVIGDNALADKITVLENTSFSVEIGPAAYQMPAKSNVVVMDISQGTLFDSLLMHDLHALNDRGMLAPDVTIIPRSARVFFQLVESGVGLPLDGLIEGFNMSAVRAHRKRGCFESTSRLSLVNLTDAMVGFRFNFSVFAATPSFAVLRFNVTRAGSLNALNVMWDAALDGEDGGVSIGNGFGSATRWDVLSCTLDDDVAVQPGMQVVVNVAHDMWNWQFTARVDGVTPKSQHRALVLVRNLCAHRSMGIFLQDVSSDGPREFVTTLHEASDAFDEDARDRQLLTVKPGDKLFATVVDEIDGDGNLIEVDRYSVRRTAVDKQNTFLITCPEDD